MKKGFFHYLSILLLLVGCATKTEVVDNTFYCSFPKLEVEVSQELQFVGEKKERMDGEGRDYQRPVRAFYKSFIFEGKSNQLTISVVKLPRDWQFVTPSIAGAENNLYFGKLSVGKHNYQYFTLREEAYIKRIYFRNAHTDTIQIRIVYMEKPNTELTSAEEQLLLFDKNCKAAFSIKAERAEPLSKPDSSISADYRKILGHWFMEGEVMVIEEIDNSLSIRMDRLRGYHRGPSGQAKYRETTNSHNISWDGEHLEFEIWMPSGAGAYEVSYSLTLSEPNTLFGTKQAKGSSTKIEVEFKKN